MKDLPPDQQFFIPSEPPIEQAISNGHLSPLKISIENRRSSPVTKVLPKLRPDLINDKFSKRLSTPESSDNETENINTQPETKKKMDTIFLTSSQEESKEAHILDNCVRQ